jgi:hypothetical protein
VTKIASIKCPACNNLIFSKVIDSVIICPQCGTLQARDGTVSIVDYEAGAFTKTSDGEKVYLPFWKLVVNFNITQEKVHGGLLSKIAGAISGDNKELIPMMLPAFDLEPLKFKELAKGLTMKAPGYTAAPLEPDVRRETCSVTIDMTDEMADFLFVTIEAEKPGVLQSLTYDLKVLTKKLVYLPYYKKGNDLVPGY